METKNQPQTKAQELLATGMPATDVLLAVTGRKPAAPPQGAPEATAAEAPPAAAPTLAGKRRNSAGNLVAAFRLPPG